MGIKKKWMKIRLSKEAILLHHNEELEQYNKLPRVPDWIVNKIIKTKPPPQKERKR